MSHEYDRYRDARVEPREVHDELERILASDEFQTFGPGRHLLDFTVKETLAGRPQYLSAEKIAQVVFGRDGFYCATDDPIVQIESARVGRKLNHYYQLAGRRNAVRILLMPRDYVPRFVRARRPSPQSATPSPAPRDQVAALANTGRPTAVRDLILPIGVPIGIVIMITLAFIQPIRTVALQFEPLQAWIAGTVRPSITVEPIATVIATSEGARKSEMLMASVVKDLAKLDEVVASSSSDYSLLAPSSSGLVLRGAIQINANLPILDLRLVDKATGAVAWSGQYEVQDQDTQRVSYEIARHIGALASYYQKNDAMPSQKPSR